MVVHTLQNAWIQSYIKLAPQISSLSGAGVGYAKNRSVQQCTGSVLVFCDADDICMEHRIISLWNALRTTPKPELTLVGSKFERIPAGSTSRYTHWANTLSNSQLYNQIFTSHGPTLIAPTWCMSRKLYDSVGGFYEAQSVGFPEDLRFFYEAVKLGAHFVKVFYCSLVIFV
ncbi:unnamed protein product [Gongylonema pulchrum]|uniref:Glyco_trans_2-like domain-containing protein n=1 Tax=Gongylonema pulchrum TaxID=637853 RepID=A0A183CWC8_9BILA|nr:unnamed protein product [Gongylonema pulchrum]